MQIEEAIQHVKDTTDYGCISKEVAEVLIDYIRTLETRIEDREAAMMWYLCRIRLASSGTIDRVIDEFSDKLYEPILKSKTNDPERR